MKGLKSLFPKRLPCTSGNPITWVWKNHSSVEQCGSITQWCKQPAGRGRPKFCSLFSGPRHNMKTAFFFSPLSCLPFVFLPAQSSWRVDLDECPEGWGLLFLFVREWINYLVNESWEFYLHSRSLIQEAMAAVLCAHLNVFCELLFESFAILI